MASIGTLTIDFAASIARLEKDVKQASGAVKQASEQIDSAVGFAKGALLSLAGALGVFSFTSMIKGAADAADAAAKMGDRFSIATENMIGLQHAANLAGVGQDILNVALRKLATNVVDAAQGSEELQFKFEQLGLNAKELAKLPLNEQFQILIERLGGVENASLRVELAQKLMGRSGSEMLSMVADGSQAIKDATGNTQAWGLALSRVDAAKIELANDALKNAKAASQGVWTTISLQLAPAVAMIADHFSNANKEAKGYHDTITQGTEAVLKFIAQEVDELYGFRLAWIAAKIVVAEFLDQLVQLDAWGNRKTAKLTFGLVPLDQELQLFAQSFPETIKDFHAQLDAVVAEGTPGPKIIAQFKQFKTQFEAEAKDFAEKRQKYLGGSGSDIPETAGTTGAGTDVLRKSLQQQLELVRKSFLDEQQLAAYHYNVAQTTLAEALGLRLITLQEYQDLSAGLAGKFANDLFKKENEAWKQKLLHLQGQYRTENEQIEFKYAEELQILDIALANEQITRQEYNRLNEQIELEHQAKLGNISAQGQLERLKFQQMTGLQQTTFVLDQLQQMTAGVANSNRAMFNLNKAVGIAQAIMSTYIGATKALEWGWPLGPIFAGVIIAAGIANVAKIASASFGSSSSAPSIAGGTAIPVTSVAASSPTPGLTSTLPVPAPQRTQVNLTLIGSQFSYQQVVDEIIPLINEAAGNGADIHVQAM